GEPHSHAGWEAQPGDQSSGVAERKFSSGGERIPHDGSGYGRGEDAVRIEPSLEVAQAGSRWDRMLRRSARERPAGGSWDSPPAGGGGGGAGGGARALRRGAFVCGGGRGSRGGAPPRLHRARSGGVGPKRSERPTS